MNAPSSMILRMALGLAVFQSLSGQEPRRTAEEIERQWRGYTSFQKHELLSFSDFLFNEGYYERTVLASFRFIFLYPDDERVPSVYYRIARSYEEMGSRDLAIEYYEQVQSEVDPASTEHLFARYRITYLNLLHGDYDRVIEGVRGSSDPYLLVFAGYAEFSQRHWKEARDYFSRARRTFGSGRRGAVLRRLIQACDRASDVPRGDPVRAALFGMVPGGGRVYLEDWFAALGTFVTTVGLGVQVLADGGSPVARWVPPLVLAGVYGGSILGSVRDVEFANRRREERYARRVQAVLGPENFLDFPEDRFFSLE
ncbi:MAG: tol-pal system YbgF family protein [Fidelibacterota bacterium]